MAILEKFEFVWPEGVTPVEFETWATTLPQAEQDELAQEMATQDAKIQQYIDRGDLVRTADGNRWIDENTRSQSVHTTLMSLTYQYYWERWMNENSIELRKSQTEI
jgi:arabinogalactan endo-1,4-beta-galactosidase